MTNSDIARAFSGHRFAETYDAFADDIVWNYVGGFRLEGREAVIDACESSTTENEGVAMSWLRFVSTEDGPVVAVDAIGRYEGPEGVSTVSSCDIYEFEGNRLTTITSYAVDVDPDDLYGVRTAGS